LSTEENDEYWVVLGRSRRALAPLVERSRQYLRDLQKILRLNWRRQAAGRRVLISNSRGATERDQAFQLKARKVHEALSAKASQFNAEFAAFIRDVDAVFVQLRIVLPTHEIDNLKGKLHPAAIESTCRVVLRLAERVEEFWTARPQSLAHEATPRNSGHDPEPDSQAILSWTDSTAVLRPLSLHLPVPKRGSSSAKMTRERWVDEKWPSRLKQARGTDPQKVAAERCGVNTETYKKWEQGVRPPAPRNMDAARRFTADLKSKT
jgi:hypothetical protein